MHFRDPLRNPEDLIRRVYAYVAYRIGPGPDAEDVTSETFERALRYRDSYDSAKGSAIAWLLGIARRCISDAAAKKDESGGELPDIVDEGSLEDDTVRRVALGAALGSLGERDRELIALRYGADLTARQIANVLGERQNTIEVALHRSLARLRSTLEAESSDFASERPLPVRDP
jgi:RNA polymerase sigma-70 factor (ECF subfamily)